MKSIRITGYLFVLLAFLILATSATALAAGAPTKVGKIKEYPIPTSGSNPYSINGGPDGNLWFTEYTGNNIGKITPKGTITEYPVPTSGSLPFDIAPGSDGNLWFVERGGNNIGRITTSGTITEFPIPTSG